MKPDLDHLNIGGGDPGWGTVIIWIIIITIAILVS
jgi:hypothetical protein